MKARAAQIERAMDAICALGCEVVNAYIVALGEGQTRAEYADLNDVERVSLQRELQAIMSIYDSGTD